MFTILVENQTVKTSWNPTTRKWYEDKGYVFTAYRQPLFVAVEDLPLKSTVKVKIKCDYCGDIVEKPYSKYIKDMETSGKNACSNCAGKKLHESLLEKNNSYQKFVDICGKNGYEVISSREEYNNAKTYLTISCPKHGIQKTTYDRAMKGRFCPICGHENGAKKITSDINDVIDAISSKNNNMLLNPEEYVNCTINNLKIKCGICGNIWTTSYASIRNSSGYCPECGKEKCHEHKRKDKNDVKRIIESINGNILLNPEDYKTAKLLNLKIKCGLCGNIFTTSFSNYVYFHVDRCPVCTKKESKGERIIREFLDKNNLTFDQEKRFEDCKDKRSLPFDFYLEDINTCIEFDGPHHYNPIYNDLKHFEDTQRHDNIKNKYCIDNNIKLIRIPYWEGHNIEKILTKELHI